MTYGTTEELKAELDILRRIPNGPRRDYFLPEDVERMKEIEAIIADREETHFEEMHKFVKRFGFSEESQGDCLCSCHIEARKILAKLEGEK